MSTEPDVTIDVGPSVITGPAEEIEQTIPYPAVDGEPPAANVIEAISRVMRDLPAIGKDQTYSGAGATYRFRGIEDITSHTQRLMAQHGVVLAPNVVQWDIIDRQAGSPPKPWTDDRLLVEYHVYGPGGRDDFILLRVPAIGRDNSDKGSNKAMTQAYKYALLQLFNIGDSSSDADAERHETSSTPIEERGDLTISRSYAEAYMKRATISGLTIDHIQAIVGAVTGGRTDQPALVLQSEWDELNERTKTTVDNRRAATRPAGHPADAADPARDPAETLTPPEPIDPPPLGVWSPVTADQAAATAPREAPVEPQDGRDAPPAPETAPEPLEGSGAGESWEQDAGTAADTHAPPDVPRETDRIARSETLDETRAQGDAIIAEAQRMDLTTIRAWLVAHKSSVQGNSATVRARYARERCMDELGGYDPFAKS